jgi:hypothetical protein
MIAGLLRLCFILALSVDFAAMAAVTGPPVLKNGLQLSQDTDAYVKSMARDLSPEVHAEVAEFFAEGKVNADLIEKMRSAEEYALQHLVGPVREAFVEAVKGCSPIFAALAAVEGAALRALSHAIVLASQHQTTEADLNAFSTEIANVLRFVNHVLSLFFRFLRMFKNKHYWYS